EERGHVYRYSGGAGWVDCGAPDPSNAISSLAVHQDRLYAGATRYNLGGSALQPSTNDAPGGRVYCYEGGSKWTDCGRPGESISISGMAEYRGRLYASSLYAP